MGNITFTMIKPEAVEAGNTGAILKRIEESGFRIVAMKKVHLSEEKAGKFYVSVPDMDILCKIFVDPNTPIKVKFDTMRIMFGGQQDEFDFHYFGWNFRFMHDLLLKAGFSKIERVKSFSLFNDTSDYAPNGVPISLNIIAQK